MRLVWAVVHGLDKASRQMARHIGVTGPQRLVLRVVGLAPGASAGDVAAFLHVHPSTLTGVLRRLVAQGLLRRDGDRRDRRRAVLRLTARGARVNGTARGTIESAIGAALDGVSSSDRATVRRVLQRLKRSLESVSSAAPRHARPPYSGGRR